MLNRTLQLCAFAIAFVFIAASAHARIPLAWESTAVSFEVYPQGDGRWIPGCGTVAPITHDVLELHGARRIRITCDDRSAFRRVFVHVQFNAPREATADTGEWAHYQAVQWTIQDPSSCDILLTVFDSLTPSFRTRNPSYSAFCNGGGGTFMYSAEVLQPESLE